MTTFPYKCQIILDMCLESTRNRQNRICVQGSARDELKKYHVMSTVLQEIGPCGHPSVRLYGSHLALETYIREVYCKDDDKEAWFHINRITPYDDTVQAATLV